MNITPLFVWQPIPVYKINKQFVLFPLGIEEHALSGVGYPLMQRYIQDMPPDPNFLWAADMQNDLKEYLYVDGVHYNERMCTLLAEFIGERILAAHSIQ